MLLSTGHSFTNVNGRRWYGNPGGAGAMTNDYLIGDFNGDGKVDKYDFALLMLYWSL